MRKEGPQLRPGVPSVRSGLVGRQVRRVLGGGRMGWHTCGRDGGSVTLQSLDRALGCFEKKAQRCAAVHRRARRTQRAHAERGSRSTNLRRMTRDERSRRRMIGPPTCVPPPAPSPPLFLRLPLPLPPLLSPPFHLGRDGRQDLHSLSAPGYRDLIWRIWLLGHREDGHAIWHRTGIVFDRGLLHSHRPLPMPVIPSRHLRYVDTTRTFFAH